MRVLALSCLFLAVPAVAFVAPFAKPAAAAALHPHFSKKIECKLPGDVTITITHITATFDAKGAEKMEPGGSWHLGNAHIEFSDALTIGGEIFEEGKYALKVRKVKGGDWELVIDKPGRFKAKITDGGQALETEYLAKGATFEHLSIDIHPAGEKKATTLNLDVRFDTKLARCEIDLPEPKKKR